MKRFEQTLIKVLSFAFSVCLLTMLVLIIAQVVLRYGFSKSIGGANELATILFAYTSALGVAVGIAQREHMAITWFVMRLKPKARKAVDVVGLLLLAALNILAFCYSLHWIQATGTVMIPVLQVPRWTAEVAIPIGTGASALFCFTKLYLGFRGEEEFGISWTQED
jgi:TRAP-type C4-dicarboxylate transport system permease small subunit